MAKFGLLGKNISYSFSRTYFTNKFESEELPNSYENFDITDISLFPAIIKAEKNLQGINVTIPYKEKIIQFLDEVSENAHKIGAVNTIQFLPDNKLKGYNTDWYGFTKSLIPFLPLKNKCALILGTGGASKAVKFALTELGFKYTVVSRTPKKDEYAYSDLSEQLIAAHSLIINCTPLGTFPTVNEWPLIPYHYINDQHLLFDLIYNPTETQFLKFGKENGAKTINGLKMLEFQAEKAWEIWNG